MVLSLFRLLWCSGGDLVFGGILLAFVDAVTGCNFGKICRGQARERLNRGLEGRYSLEEGCQEGVVLIQDGLQGGVDRMKCWCMRGDCSVRDWYLGYWCCIGC